MDDTTVSIRCKDEPWDLDYASNTQDLARIVAHRHLLEGTDGPGEYGFRRLSEMLVRRVDAEAARERRTRRAEERERL